MGPDHTENIGIPSLLTLVHKLRCPFTASKCWNALRYHRYLHVMFVVFCCQVGGTDVTYSTYPVHPIAQRLNL